MVVGAFFKEKKALHWYTKVRGTLTQGHRRIYLMKKWEIFGILFNPDFKTQKFSGCQHLESITWGTSFGFQSSNVTSTPRI